MFKSIFSKKSEPEPPEIEGLTIGRTVSFDPIVFKLIPKDSLLETPDSTVMITAQGHCDLGEQSHLHRFYFDDDRFLLQIQGGDGHDDNRIDEMMLWYFIDVQYPSQVSDWTQIKKQICEPHFDLLAGGANHRFERSWFETSTTREDPMTYWETIVEQRNGSNRRKIFQTAMLYVRSLQNQQDEVLLVNLEEAENGEKSIAYMIGRLLQRHEFSV